jgi:hypothetical protein
MAVKPVKKSTPTPGPTPGQAGMPTPGATPKATVKPTVQATPKATAKTTVKQVVTPTAPANAWQSGTFPGVTPKPTVAPTTKTPVVGPKTGTTVGESPLPTGINPYYVPAKDTTLTDYTQTSKQDIAAIVNATMQNLVGRNATESEIQTYGAELLAAEKSNPTIVKQTTNREGQDQPNPGLATSLTGGTVSSGVNPQSFLENLISQTGQAKDFKVATGYFQGMLDANTKFSGAYNG